MVELFKKNLEFFYKNLPHYYELIKSIESRNFYIKDDNIYDKNNNPIYPVPISKFSEYIATYPTNNKEWQKHFLYIHPYNWNEERFYITGKIINNLIKKAKSIKSYSENGFFFDKDFLPTTSIYGILAGAHIQKLIEKFEFQSLFLYEPNPEFFAMSLYFIDYQKMYEKLGERLFLWIKGKVDYIAIDKFFYERTITSSFMHLYYKTYNHPFIDDALNKFEEVRESKLRGWGTYEDEMVGVKNFLKTNGKYPILADKKKIDLPFCVVANGKSLEKNIEFIKKNQNNMIIVSAGTAIKPLLNAGIESDFHIEQERNQITIEALKDILPNFNGYFVGSNVVKDEVFQMAKHPLMYIRTSFTLSTEYVLPFSGPIVGNAAIAFAANFTDTIYLCGMDLGFRLNDKKHATGSLYDDYDDIQKDGIKVEGNFSDDIYSDSLLLSSKFIIEKMIESKNLKVYNLSDGALIKGAKPTKDATLKPIDKEKIKKEILTCFKNIKIKTPEIKLEKILSPLKKTLDRKTKNIKELTGLIDFIEDSLTIYEKTPEFALLRGSIFHILNNLYILSHKVKRDDIEILKRKVQKEISRYYKDFNKVYK